MSLPPPRRKPVATRPKSPVDKTGLKIPANLLESWLRRGEVFKILGILLDLRCNLKRIEEDRDPLFARVPFNGIWSSLKHASASIELAKPSYVCPICGGNPEVLKGCNLCKGFGLLSDFHWQSVPEELKSMRKIAVIKQNQP